MALMALTPSLSPLRLARAPPQRRSGRSDPPRREKGQTSALRALQETNGSV